MTKEGATLRISYRRVDGGAPIRQAMKDGGWKLMSLAERTAEVDPEKQGVSWQLISLIYSDRPWARETLTQRSAELITAALGDPEGALFAKIVTPLPDDSAQDEEEQSVA